MSNDLISRSALIAEYDRVHVGTPGGARKLMENATAVDAVEVVRCKDCKKHLHDDDVDFLCGHTGMYTRFDDFCSYGERKDNG